LIRDLKRGPKPSPACPGCGCTLRTYPYPYQLTVNDWPCWRMAAEGGLRSCVRKFFFLLDGKLPPTQCFCRAFFFLPDSLRPLSECGTSVTFRVFHQVCCLGFLDGYIHTIPRVIGNTPIFREVQRRSLLTHVIIAPELFCFFHSVASTIPSPRVEHDSCLVVRPWIFWKFVGGGRDDSCHRRADCLELAWSPRNASDTRPSVAIGRLKPSRRSRPGS